DVADGAADLDHAHGRVLGALEDRLLDLVRDVRDHLHGRAEVLAAPLLRDHVRVDPARREVAVAARLRADEALVVAEIEVRLRAVLGHEHLAVLKRAHRSGIDVDVRIELDQADLEPARLEDRAETSGCDPLAERRHDAAGDENESGHTPPARTVRKITSKKRACLAAALPRAQVRLMLRRRCYNVPERPRCGQSPSVDARMIEPTDAPAR